MDDTARPGPALPPLPEHPLVAEASIYGYGGRGQVSPVLLDRLEAELRERSPPAGGPKP